MIVSALAFLSGSLLLQTFQVLPGQSWLVACMFLAAVLAGLNKWRLLWLPLGFVWAAVVANNHWAQQLPESLAGIDIPVQGRIVGLPDQTGQKARFDFIVEKSELKLPHKLRLSGYHAEQKLTAGQHWVFTVRLKPPHGNLNPGGFDYERWLFTQGIGATGYVRPYPKPKLMGQDPPWRNIDVLRQTISDRLDANLADAGMIKALTIGEGSGIGQDQWEVFRKTGTIHLVVISGSHIGMVAGLVYWLVQKCWAWTGYLRWPPQRVAAWAAMAAGLFYAALAGFSVPSQRAAIMLVVFMVAIIQQRPVRPFNALAIALLAVLFYDPLAVLAPGFWLSFLAVALIVFTVAGRLGKPSLWLETVKINWVTSIGLSPLLLWFFQQVSLCSPLANFIAVPVIGLFVVPLALLGVVLLFVHEGLAGGLLLALDSVLQALHAVLAMMAAWPLAVFDHPQPPFWALWFALPGIALLLAPRGIPGRWLGLIMLLPLLATEPKKPAYGEMELTLLDVGQGLALTVQTSGHWLVYDTGAKYSEEYDSGLTVLVPFLRNRGVTRLDGLVISHGDNDHIGGAGSLLQAIPARTILTSVPEKLPGHPAKSCKTGQSWAWDGVGFEMLSPGEEPFLKENDNSCVLKITGKSGAVLLTGDIEKTAESWLVDRYGPGLRAEVLIAPHHGSKTSSSLGFLRAVGPGLVVIPAGYRNPFGHPHKKVLARYQSNRMVSANTAEDGALTVITGRDHAPLLRKFRETDGKYWNWRPTSLQ